MKFSGLHKAIIAVTASAAIVVMSLIATGRDALTRSLEAYWASLYFPCASDEFRFDVTDVRVANGVTSFNDSIGFHSGVFADEAGRSLFIYEMDDIVSVGKRAESPSLEVCFRDGHCAKTYGAIECDPED